MTASRAPISSPSSICKSQDPIQIPSLSFPMLRLCVRHRSFPRTPHFSPSFAIRCVFEHFTPKYSYSNLLDRLFSTHPLHRPQLPLCISSSLTPTIKSLPNAPSLDLLPKISAHPSLASLQVRNGPRNTFNPSHRVRKRRHGFLSRLRTRTGRMTLKRRRVKGRSTLSH